MNKKIKKIIGILATIIGIVLLYLIVLNFNSILDYIIITIATFVFTN